MTVPELEDLCKSLREKLADAQCEADELAEAGDLEDRLEISFRITRIRVKLHKAETELRFHPES